MTYRRYLLAALPVTVALAIVPKVVSQDAPTAAGTTPAAPPMTMEERRASIGNVEQHIADREARIEQIRATMKKLDARVEKGIGGIVTKLEGMDDSQESQVRVAMTKSDTIDGLHKTIEYYARKRDDLREQLKRASDIPRDTLLSDLKIFDERIEKRVRQIIDLTKSFAEFKDLKKYNTYSSSHWGWSYNNVKISDKWRTNRKQVRRTESEQKKVIGELQRSVDRMVRGADDYKEKLRNPNLSDRAREIYESDLDYLQRQIDNRRDQIAEVSSPGGKTPGRKVSRNEAHSFQMRIDDDIKDLRWDFFAIFENYDKLNKERRSVASLKKNLKARKDWLAENDK